MSIFQRCCALAVCNSQTSKSRPTRNFFVVDYNQALKTKCVLFNKRVVTGLTILYLALASSDTFKKAKNSEIDSSAGGAYNVLPDPPVEQ